MEEGRALPIVVSSGVTRVVFAGLTTFSFVLPFAFGHSQFLTGPLVNAALFSAAVFLPEKLFLPIIFLPSLAVLTRGVIFGPLTPFLTYFLLFIWFGNLVLVVVFKRFSAKFGFVFSIALAALVKFLVLYIGVNLLFSFQLVPQLFLQTMGINQLITAVIGGLFTLFALRIINYERV